MHCQQIVRAHARTFWLASRFLPAHKRRAAFAMYAFCRVADDLVDTGSGASSELALRVREYRDALEAALEGRPSGPVFRELAFAAREYGVPACVLRELLDGVARDCAPAQYDTWDELSRYCEGVASSVGEMCTHVFGVVGDERVRERATVHARTLGTAMQLTNILRDVGEDARAGRCYLPTEDLERFGLTRDAVLGARLAHDDAWKELMRFEIARARSLYEYAMPGIPLLSPDSRRCATACAVGYAGILGAIERIEYDTFATRARLGTAERASVLWQAWRTPLGTVADVPAAPPVVTWA
ncbi:MAG: phytoene/squalene synthase family protein [Gemmatimonadaceae bacterium]